MTIEELLERKQELELQIRTSINAAISEFRRDTGLSPSSIDIEFIDVTEMGAKRPELEMADCKVTVEI